MPSFIRASHEIERVLFKHRPIQASGAPIAGPVRMSMTDRPYVMLCIGGMRRNPVRFRGCRATVTGKFFLTGGHGVSRKAEDGRRSGSQETPAADDRPPT